MSDNDHGTVRFGKFRDGCSNKPTEVAVNVLFDKEGYEVKRNEALTITRADEEIGEEHVDAWYTDDEKDLPVRKKLTDKKTRKRTSTGRSDGNATTTALLNQLLSEIVGKGIKRQGRGKIVSLVTQLQGKLRKS